MKSCMIEVIKILLPKGKRVDGLLEVAAPEVDPVVDEEVAILFSSKGRE